MTHLWIQNRDGFWQEHDLADGAVTLSTNGPAPTDSSNKSGNPSQPMLVPHSGPHGSETWVLLAGPLSRMRINGLPIPVGIRVLTDRDAITLDAGHTVYFSSERLAEVIPLPGPRQRQLCALQTADRTRFAGRALPGLVVRLLVSPERRPAVLDLYGHLRGLPSPD